MRKSFTWHNLRYPSQECYFLTNHRHICFDCQTKYNSILAKTIFVVYHSVVFAENIGLALSSAKKMAKAIWKNQLPRVCFYAMFVFVSIFIVLALRSASLIWIHNVGMIGFTPLKLFIRELLISVCVSAIQTVIILPGLIIFSLRQDIFSLRRIVVAILPLCILDLLIKPIGIWTMYYQILGPILTICAVVIFPLITWLFLFTSFPNKN